MIVALAVFVFTYLFLAGAELPGLRLDRQGGALAGAVGMVVFGVLTPAQAVREGIDWDTLLLLLGMMILTSVLGRAGVFRWVSWAALRRARTPVALLAAVVLVSGVLSALLVNDTVCAMCTPLVLAVVDAAGLPALPYLLGLAFGANAGSVATLTGNPQNMLIGQLSRIPYARFAAAELLPAGLSLLSVLAVLWWTFRRELREAHGRRPPHALPEPALDVPLAWLCALVLSGVVLAFLLGANLPFTALAGAAILLAFGRAAPREVLAGVDGGLLLFFASLFVVTHGVAQSGLAERLHAALAPAFGIRPVAQTLRFGVFTLAACQLVSNVPFVLVAARWVPHLAAPRLGWLSLAAVSTLAGNLTPVASVANLIVLELAGDRGRIPFFRFLRIGAAATLVPLGLSLAILLLEARLGWT